MKLIIVIVVVVLAFMSSTLHAGYSGDATVSIDLGAGVASGNMWYTRSSKNDVEVIGCGYKGAALPNESPWWPEEDIYRWGWCQAVDTNGVHVLCLTKDSNLLDAMQAISPFSYIRFKFTNLDENNVGDCTRLNFSTQSQHLPNFTTKNK
jgi:hypothetical protein